MNLVLRPNAEERLADLRQRARAELAMLSFATKPWVLPRDRNGRRQYDVVVIGGGQSGLILGHALLRSGMANILILDKNPEGYEGVWETFARNHEIRSPKEITGAELGVPSLSIQSWYEARHGREAWEAIKRVPRTDWMAYLRWYRTIVDLPIRNDTVVTDITYDSDGVTLTVESKGQASTIDARLAVLATGMDGGGQWQVPAILTDNLPADRYNHSNDIFDASVFRGQRVGILGAGAAAFDVAVSCLTEQAASVEMFLRRPRLPLIDAAREIETVGFLNHYPEMADATKWAVASFMNGLSQSPAEHHFYKATGFPNFRMRAGAPWEEVTLEADGVHVMTPKGSHVFDHIFAATGAVVDMNRRPELRRIAEHSATWRDRFSPPADNPNPGRLNFPYLNRTYQFTEREPGVAPGIERIFAFNSLCALSMGGMSALSISCHKFGIPRLVRGITSFLWLEQEQAVVDTLRAYQVPGITVPPHVCEMLGMPVGGEAELAATG